MLHGVAIARLTNFWCVIQEQYWHSFGCRQEVILTLLLS